jgi:Tol biopolymer transport system component
VTGGTPVTVSDVSSFFGASWGDDDSIVFGQADGIWKVAASGGTPERLITIQPREQLHLPQMLPDGKSVLFTLTAGVGDARWDDDARVVVQSLDTGQRHVIRTGASNARYLPTGHLLYVLGSVLFAIPYDVATHEVRGAPVPVVESVLRGVLYPGAMGAAGYDVSNDGTLVYAPSRAQIGPNDVVTVDHAGKSDVLVRERRPYWRPAVSPDGERVVVEVSNGLSGARHSAHLWMIDRRGITAQPFTLDGVTNWAPLWSRDGQSIVFISDRDKVFGIYRKPADGSREPELIHRSDVEVVTTSASPDGIVAFSRGPQTGARDIWTVNLSDRSATAFLATPAMEHMAMFSPDGKWIAYVSNESGQAEVYVRPYPKVEGRVRRVSHDGGTAPIWAPDSSALYYRNAKGMLMTAPVQLDPVLTTGTARPLFEVSSKFRSSGNTAAYDITPDGKRFVMTTLPDITDRTPEQIHVVVNWSEELKQRAPAR